MHVTNLRKPHVRQEQIHLACETGSQLVHQRIWRARNRRIRRVKRRGGTHFVGSHREPVCRLKHSKSKKTTTRIKLYFDLRMRIYKIEMNENDNGSFSPPCRRFRHRHATFPPQDYVRTQSDYGFYNVTEFQGYNVVILLQAIVLKAIA